jgi:hypothetical protein
MCTTRVTPLLESLCDIGVRIYEIEYPPLYKEGYRGYLTRGQSTGFAGKCLNSVGFKRAPEMLTIKDLVGLEVTRISVGPSLQLSAMKHLKEVPETILSG